MNFRSGRRYLTFFGGCALTWVVVEALLTLTIRRGYDPPQPHPFNRSLWIVDRDVMSDAEWQLFAYKHPILAVTTWVFLTAGATTTLPNDFNKGHNSIYAIGAGAAGAAGTGGSNAGGGIGGVGGGGGAFAQINNYSNKGPGQSVNTQVGTGDSVWDSVAFLKAQGASGATPGSAASSVGTTKSSGGGGGAGGTGGGSFPNGGGGGGAGGPNGAGGAGANAGAGAGQFGAGGTADNGTTAAGANGTELGPNVSSQFIGSGGGGNAGFCNTSGTAGSNAGFYGGGGGGGGGGAATCPMGFCTTNGGAGGNGTQGALAFSYTPVNNILTWNFPFLPA